MTTALIVVAGVVLVMGVGTIAVALIDRWGDGGVSPQQAYDGYWEGGR
ncbi:MAG: hypothetical protein ABW189_08705 [Rickettsiales bacterium]